MLKSIIRFALAAAVFVSAAYAQTAVPKIINYQGKLTDASGIAINGTRNIVFRIYDNSTAGTMLWQESHTGGSAISIVNGLFDVQLGIYTTINLAFNDTYYIQLTVEGEDLLPRERLAVVPYAFRALNADTAYVVASGAVHVTARLTGDGSATTPLDIAQMGATSGQVLTWNGTTWAPASGTSHTHATLSQGTGITAFSYDGSTAATVGLANTGVTAGTYGNTGTNVSQITVDAQGRLTAASSRTLSLSDFGGTPTTRTLTVNGTTNQVDVTGGTQDLSANRTWTVALASNAILPGTASMTMPIGTTAQRPGTPVNGMTRYNSTDNIFEFYQNGAWTRYGTGGGTITSIATTAPITGGPITTTGTIGLDQNGDILAGSGALTVTGGTNVIPGTDAADVTIGVNFGTTAGTVAEGNHAHAGTYDNYGYWELQANGAAGANIATHGIANFVGAGIATVSRSSNTITITATEVDGSTSNEIQNLSYTATTRALGISSGTGVTLPVFTSTEAGLAPASGGGTTNFLRADGTWGAPVGTTYSAGTGLTLTGTTFSHTAHTGDATGATALTVVALQGRPVSSTAPTSNQILKWNGTAWAPAADSDAGGDLTAITAGTGISVTDGTGPIPTVAFNTTWGDGRYIAHSHFTTNGVMIRTGIGTYTTESPLSVTYGGTGLSSVTANGILFGNGTAALGIISAPTVSNTYLRWNGTAFEWASASSALANLTAGNGIVSFTYNGGSAATVTVQAADGTIDVTATGIKQGNGATKGSSTTYRLYRNY